VKRKEAKSACLIKREDQDNIIPVTFHDHSAECRSVEECAVLILRRAVVGPHLR
jgi:hypothetical protein